MGKTKKDIQCEIKHYNEDQSNLTACINSSMLTDLSMTFHDAVSGSYISMSTVEAVLYPKPVGEGCRIQDCLDSTHTRDSQRPL